MLCSLSCQINRSLFPFHHLPPFRLINHLDNRRRQTMMCYHRRRLRRLPPRHIRRPPPLRGLRVTRRAVVAIGGEVPLLEAPRATHPSQCMSTTISTTHSNHLNINREIQTPVSLINKHSTHHTLLLPTTCTLHKPLRQLSPACSRRPRKTVVAVAAAPTVLRRREYSAPNSAADRFRRCRRRLSWRRCLSSRNRFLRNARSRMAIAEEPSRSDQRSTFAFRCFVMWW